MSEIHGAVGTYVVNALDPDEREAFEAHLAVCPACSREVAEFGETAAELPLLASVPPPPVLRESILAAISEVRPLPPEPAAEAAPAKASPGWTATAPPEHPVNELALRVLTAPDVQTYSATMKDGGQISFVVSRSLDRALFIGKDLPSVGADRTYQLWTLEGEQAIPDNLVTGGGDRKQFFRETLGGVTGLAISIETAGGAQQPTPSAIQVVTELAT